MPDLPDLTDLKWQTAHSDAELKQSILNGMGKFMLPMKDKLSPADAEQMVAYMRAFRYGKQIVQAEPQLPVLPQPPALYTVVSNPNARPAVPPPSALADEETAARTRVAAGLYRQYCLICHGTDGRGTEMRASMPTIPDHTGCAWQERLSNPQLVVSILEGKGTLMPSFRGRVNDEQAQDLAAYVRAFGPARAVPPAASASGSDFEKRYRELQEKWNELQRQLNALSGPPRKP
jgi:mono/diheme cytochrome c family protein